MKTKLRSIQSKTPRASLLIKLTILLCACSPNVLAQWTQPNTSGDINSTNTGNVGVGTTTPSAKLTVSNNTESAPAGQPGTTAQIVGADGATTRFVVDSFGAGATSIDLRRANNTALSPSALLSGNLIGQITWQGYGGTFYSSTPRARIGVHAAENYTDTAQGSFMTFSVASRGGIAMAEAMRIDATGFVGLGTGAPVVKLDVLGLSAPAFRAVRDNATIDSPSANAGTAVLYNSNVTANNFVGLGFQTRDTAGNVRNLSFIKSVATARTTTGVSGDIAFAVSNGATLVEALRVTSGSRVGIGTSAPNFKLDLQGGQINSSGGLCIAGDCRTAWSQVSSQWTTSGTTINYSGGNVGIGTGAVAPVEKLEVVGNIKVSGNINAKYQDVAEWVESSQELPPGTVVVLDTSKSNQVIASTESYDSRIAGVISLQPGLTLGEQAEGRVLVATTGRVKVKVDATSGPIQIGDLLVTSSREGFAMKSMPVDVGGVQMHRPGTLIGKALEPLVKGTGEILVLLSLQ
jgi:hypothetical protein